MRRYWLAAGITIACFTVVFVAVEAFGFQVLTHPRSTLDSGGWTAGMVGVALLAGDALLPVPSSIVMVAHGALFGALTGASLSLAGRGAAAAAGFAIGRRGGALLERFVGPNERERADRLLQRWGVLGIVASRPVPLVAETTMVLAGASPMSWPLAMAAALAGSLPEVLVYALAGSAATNFGGTSVIFLSLLAITALTWMMVERLGHGAARTGSTGRRARTP